MPEISEMVSVPAGHVTLGGDFFVPAQARAMVLSAHGIDSSRHSTRTRSVAAELRAAGLGTLALDLLSEHEDRGDAVTAQQPFDVELLGRRVVAGADWLKIQPDSRALPIVLCGTGTEAAAVLQAAAELPDRVLSAVVWGGRPDLAGAALGRIQVPVLLIAGGRDPGVQRLTEDAAQQLGAPHSVRVVPEATRLFQEPGTLEQVVAMIKEWCDDRLSAR
ncbi:dienelactone hydrolase family protein [Streptomyces sp. TRM68367]|uniref:dienelactone hydrolase family protein n=1 Tax=Streptomyces sp. TRM68367 TaxID=2758415 RepID=UPI0021D3D67A|nr:dienelactone hydrolase family protein [Streptomyces sp. TRM68367]